MNSKINAVITGAAGLLGKNHAEALVELGYNVYLTDINYKQAKLISLEINSKNFKGKAFARKLDVTSNASLTKFINEIKKIDILINNAAINPKLNTILGKKKILKYNQHSIDFKKFQKELDIGLTGYLKCTVKFGNLMAKNKFGIIVNIASDLSVIAPNQFLYNDSYTKKFTKYKPASYSIIKHGIIGMTKYFATFWSNDNIRVNALSPGGVFENQDIKFVKKLKKLIPMNRMANQNDYKAAIKFLCSNDSNYMTGHNLIIDGGRSIW